MNTGTYTEAEVPQRAPIRRVALVAPMRSELRPLAAPLGLVRSTEFGPEAMVGSVGRVEIVAARSGIGMRAGARCAERLLDAAAPDHLVVVGIAGGIGGSIAVGDLVVPEVVLNLETGRRFRPAPFGGHASRGTLASGDALLTSPDEARKLVDSGVVAVDMETAAIAEVCADHGCPWSVFRAISDRADDGTTDDAVLGLVGADGTPDLLAVARFVLRQPRRIPQLIRLGRGARTAVRVAAHATIDAIHSL